MRADWPYVKAYTDRHGTRRYYFRRKGFPSVALPGRPGAPAFVAAYDAALNGEARIEPKETLVRGSLKALCHAYENSAEFSSLGDLTRREMGYVIKALVAKHADKPVKLLERRHILQWRDGLKDKPGAANKMIRVVKCLMTFALERGYRADNPAQGVKMLKIGEWRPWTLEEIGSFEARWPLGTLARTGFALALYTGQRRADVARLKWSSIAGDGIRLKQGKTGAEMLIPIHPELAKALAAIHPRSEEAILAKNGRRLNIVYFGHLMAEAIGKAGLPAPCVLHGLRKSAAVALIDAGCTPHQASAITGHRTTRMLEHYAKRRDQAKLGKAAMLKWTENK
jgi:integrase